MKRKGIRLQRNGKQKRGFACMTLEARTEIARSGGLAISKDRRWMKKLGKLGGRNSHRGSQKAA